MCFYPCQCSTKIIRVKLKLIHRQKSDRAIKSEPAPKLPKGEEEAEDAEEKHDDTDKTKELEDADENTYKTEEQEAIEQANQKDEGCMEDADETE